MHLFCNKLRSPASGWGKKGYLLGIRLLFYFFNLSLNLLFLASCKNMLLFNGCLAVVCFQNGGVSNSSTEKTQPTRHGWANHTRILPY